MNKSIKILNQTFTIGDVAEIRFQTDPDSHQREGEMSTIGYITEIEAESEYTSGMGNIY